MCGRFVLAVAPEDVEAEFSMIRIEWFPPRYNIAPTQPILVVRAEKGERRPALVRWGLVPSWTKDLAALPLFFNARSETAPQKPAFRGAFRHRRCLIPASGFYEWRRPPEGLEKTQKKQPFYLRPRGRAVVAFAGLWDEWADANGNLLDSAAILTTAANADVASIHDRMPVVIAPADYDRWLGLDGEPGEAEALLRPPPAGTFEAIPVDPRVNSARIDDPRLIEPAGPAEPAPEPAAPAPKQLKLI